MKHTPNRLNTLNLTITVIERPNVADDIYQKLVGCTGREVVLVQGLATTKDVDLLTQSLRNRLTKHGVAARLRTRQVAEGRTYWLEAAA